MNLNIISWHNDSPVPMRVRWITLLVLLVSLGAGVATVIDRYTQLRQQAGRDYHPYLAQIGLSEDFYVGYFLTMEVLLALVFVVTGIVIALHRSANWMTLFAAYMLMLFGATVPPPLHALVVVQHSFGLPVQLVRSVGLVSFILFFYVFPDGQFRPRWTRLLAIVLLAWSFISLVYAPANWYHWSHPLPFVALVCWFSTGVFAQIHRYIHTSDPVRQQQTKWVVYGLTAAVLGDLITHAPWYLFPTLQKGPDLILLLVHHPLFILSQLLVPVSIGFSIFRYGLWEIDLIINRTLVYGLLTTLVAAVWATSTKLLEVVFEQMIGDWAEPIAAGLSVLVIGIAFGTTRKRLEIWFNRYIYHGKIDFNKEFIEFLPEALATIHLPDLLHILIRRTLELMQIRHGAVFVSSQDGIFQLTAVHNIKPEAAISFTPSQNVFNQLQKGVVIAQADVTFPLLVPLVLPQEQGLIGILALGTRTNGRGYSHEERQEFKTLGNQAGTAIYIARLNMANQKELKQQLTSLKARIEAIEARM